MSAAELAEESPDVFNGAHCTVDFEIDGQTYKFELRPMERYRARIIKRMTTALETFCDEHPSVAKDVFETQSLTIAAICCFYASPTLREQRPDLTTRDRTVSCRLDVAKFVIETLGCEVTWRLFQEVSEFERELLEDWAASLIGQSVPNN